MDTAISFHIGPGAVPVIGACRHGRPARRKKGQGNSMFGISSAVDDVGEISASLLVKDPSAVSTASCITGN